MTNFKSVAEFANECGNGQFGVTMIAVTEPKMRKTNNALFGRVHKATYLSNVALGYDYENSVNNRCGGGFVAEKPNGKHFIGKCILAADKNENQHYLRTTMRKNTISKSIYLVDGRIASDAEVEQIKSFLPPTYESKKQAEVGLEGAEQVIVRDYKLEGIICLTLGDRVFNRIGFIDPAELRSYFK